VVVAAVWVIDDTWMLQVGLTGIVVLVLVGIWAAFRASTQAVEQLRRESLERRRDLADTQRELAELKTQHVELLLELRAMRDDAALAAQAAARAAAQLASDDADQRALIHQLTQPRQPVLDPVYPSLHLPLVRAAFSTELPTGPIATPRPAAPGLQRESTTGGEAHPPRQLLDLTASEIARLRPAN
jgi:FtsZ-interacting cell division protein ZipA